LVFHGADPVVICELADVEMASLLRRARRDGRIDDDGVAERLDAYQAHTAATGPLAVVPLTQATIARARELVLKTTVRTLDALHLAAAQLLAEVSEEEMTLLTRDAAQATAAAALGFSLYAVPETRA